MIQINMDPNILQTSLFVISWHGLLSFIAVATAVFLTVRWTGPSSYVLPDPKNFFQRVLNIGRRFLNSGSDLFLGKLEKELEAVITQVRDVASEYFRDIRLREVAEEPQAIALGSGDLPAKIRALSLEPGMRVTVVTRAGAVVADTADDPSIRDTETVRRDAQAVLNGYSSMSVRTINRQEHAVFVYPIRVERPVATKVEVPSESGAGRTNVLMERTERIVGGAVRITVPTGAVRVRTLDAVYGVAIWGIIGGIIGSRIVHVIDEWRFYGENPGQIIAIWNGGIGLWGALLGGFAAGVVAARFYKVPVGRMADQAGLSMLIAQAIGRVGDIINGEHISEVTNRPWGFVWSNPESPTFRSYGLAATHPAVVYELIWDLLLFFFLWRFVRGRLKPDGMLFVAYMAFYSFGRYFIQYYRVDRIWFAGLQEAQVIALIVMAITVPLLAFRAHIVPRETPEAPSPQRRVAPAGSRGRGA
ncbi:MAG: hypothetical protein FJ315_03490 [SAR202 cluster bacterium]|nr:hypothetical protein [SAR202 cluster bacterium]